jgi:hypothetical protein
MADYEEQKLEQRFGKAYVEYKRKVPKWIFHCLTSKLEMNDRWSNMNPTLKSLQNQSLFMKNNQKFILLWASRWRGVRDLNPRGLKGHRLSRPAPYQARATPPSNYPECTSS